MNRQSIGPWLPYAPLGASNRVAGLRYQPSNQTAHQWPLRNGLNTVSSKIKPTIEPIPASPIKTNRTVIAVSIRSCSREREWVSGGSGYVGSAHLTGASAGGAARRFAQAARTKTAARGLLQSGRIKSLATMAICTRVTPGVNSKLHRSVLRW